MKAKILAISWQSIEIIYYFADVFLQGMTEGRQGENNNFTSCLKLGKVASGFIGVYHFTSVSKV